MKLDYIKDFKGIIECKTGLRIGGSKEMAGVGESDNPIIRHPVTQVPYIPGSSIKGKLRSLLELRYSVESQNSGNPCSCGNCFICTLFGRGMSRRRNDDENEPTRLIFRDAMLKESSLEDVGSAETSAPFTEVKSEVGMDRKKGTVNRFGPRHMERVPSGAIFNFEFGLRVFEGDKSHWSDWREKLAEAFDLLEQDYIGGCGTRGYGKIVITLDGQSVSSYLRNLDI